MSATVPDPPISPEPYECCGRGCCPCIFDYYEDALARWKALVTARGLDPDALLMARAKSTGAKP